MNKHNTSTSSDTFSSFCDWFNSDKEGEEAPSVRGFVPGCVWLQFIDNLVTISQPGRLPSLMPLHVSFPLITECKGMC